MKKIIVIGGGLIGAAAIRHLSAETDGIIALAPSEPMDRQTHAGVFASHYDEGRLTRILDSHPAWAATAARSIARYAEIEMRSGIKVFTPSGFLSMGADGTEGLIATRDTGRSCGAEVEELDADEIAARFPMLSVERGSAGLVERGTAGHISPRNLVRAQLAIAKAQGAKIVDAAAVSVRAVQQGVEVTAANGETYRAERALIATGGFTNACGLTLKPLDMRVYGRTVVLFEISDALQDDFRGMPTLVHREVGAYILPPIRYPNGKTYLKIGIGTDADQIFTDMEGLRGWFRGKGSAENRAEFTAFITGLIPALRTVSQTHTDTCIVTKTPTDLPYIDFVDEDRRIAVAVAGNGKGAKGSDEWGRAASLLLLDAEWDVPVAAEELRARFG
jgi:sarcosine oxidase